MWGVPGDPGHNSSRGWECLQNGFFGTGAPCEPLRETGAPPPFLTLPASCMTPWSPTVSADSWDGAGGAVAGRDALHDAFGQPLGLSGWYQLTFEPSISVAADGQAGSSPTGLTTTIHVPQTAGLNPEGDAQATVKDTTVTLPEGVALNPSAADGLSACGESEVGLEDAAEVTCPESSKVGTVETHTPVPEPAHRGGVPGDPGSEPVRELDRVVCRGAGPGVGGVDQGRGAGHTEPGHRAARRDVQRNTGSAVRRLQPELLRGVAGAVEYPAVVR